MRALLARLRSLSPTVVVGVLLLLTGVGIALGAVTLSAGFDLTASLVGLLRWVARVVNAGDDTVRRAEMHLNGVVYQVLRDELPRGGQGSVSFLRDKLSLALASLFSPSGMLTLLALLASYPFARRAFDARFPGARSRD